MRRHVKKLVAAILAMTMVCGLGMTAFAAKSPTSGGVVNKIVSAVDKNGNAVSVEIQEMPQEYQEVAAQIRDLGTVKSLLGAQFVEGMEVVDVRNVVVTGDKSQINWPIDITFEVPGVLTTTKVAVLHYSDEKQAWEVVPSKVGKGTITATFDSLSPVAFVVDKNTSASAVGNGSTTSPKTGEGMVVPFLGTAAIVLALGAVICLRKREAK